MSGMSDINWLFFKYYSDNPLLRHIVGTHSEAVARKALRINEEKHLHLDPKDVYVAAMVHDIGVVKCSAPDIGAKGSLPYLQHGLAGKRILEHHGLKKFARICTSHTGAGISKEEIKESNLPLPPSDEFMPHSLLEKLICYSDKFFSKSKDLKKEKSLEEVLTQMKKFGSGPYQRFLGLHELFG